MEFNIWLKDRTVTMIFGGDPEKNKPPLVTATLHSPQIIIEPDKNKIKVVEPE
jgi:hypothetical protein